MIKVPEPEMAPMTNAEWPVLPDLLLHEGMNEGWQGGFEVGRHVVLLQLGPYRKLYLRPDQFTKRFYHQVFPLNIDTWQVSKTAQLFDDYCQIDYQVQISVQATLAYAQRYQDDLPEINPAIRLRNAAVIDAELEKTLPLLEQGKWIAEGFHAIENLVTDAINELFVLQQLNVETRCSIRARFQDYPEIKPGREGLEQRLLKSVYDSSQRERQERMRQVRIEEAAALEEKKLKLEHVQRMTALEREIQAAEAERTRLLLEDRKAQLQQQLEIRKQLHAQQLDHQFAMKQLAFDRTLAQNAVHSQQNRTMEAEELEKLLAHQSMIEELKARAQKAQQQHSDFLRAMGYQIEENPAPSSAEIPGS